MIRDAIIEIVTVAAIFSAYGDGVLWNRWRQAGMPELTNSEAIHWLLSIYIIIAALLLPCI